MNLILLITEDGENLGRMTMDEARKKAKEYKLDLILVGKDNCVYKLGDSGKLNYDRKQKNRKQRAKKRENKIKEIQIRPTTDKGDLDIKAKKIRGFLKNGLRTKLIMRFKRSQINYKSVGMEKVNNLVDQLINDEIATVESPPKFDGNNILVFLIPTGK